jgi:hypothetical protein
MFLPPQLLDLSREYQEGDFQAVLPAQQQQDFFAIHALAAVSGPDPEGRGGDPQYPAGLFQHRNAQANEADDWKGHLFDDDSDPHVIVFAPYVRVTDANDPNYNNQHPADLPAAWGTFYLHPLIHLEQ